MRLVLVGLAGLWGLAAVYAFAVAADKSGDARLSAAYILLWPLAVLSLAMMDRPPLWLGVPVMFGLLPWLLAGPHLMTILRDPSQSRPNELIGIPRPYWTWGGLGAVLLGIVFNGYA